MKIFGNYTQEELDRQYDQAALVPNIDEYETENRARSAEVRNSLECRLNVSYGPTLDEVLDVFPARKPGGPIHVYHHGGAWKSSHKDNCSYIAEAFLSRGVNLVIPNFALAPKVSLDEIVRQNRAAVAWTWHHADSFGGNREQLYVCGHSSGGHLAGMMLVTDWEGEYGLPRDLIKGATPISGMYDLGPVRLSYRNQYLFMDERAARRNSPLLHIPERRTPLVIGYGACEHEEFKRQSEVFAAAWEAAGNRVEKIVMKGRNHFDVEREFADPDSSIMRSTWAYMGLE